jgi:hypothetical protein
MPLGESILDPGRDELAERIRRLVASALSGSTAIGALRERLHEAVGRAIGPALGAHPVDGLPCLTCAAAGGEAALALPLAGVSQLLRLSAKLLDDAQDGEGKGSPVDNLSLALGLIFLAPLVLQLLFEQGVAWQRIERVNYELNRAALRATAGQHADVQASVPLAPDDWLAIALAKSGEVFGWAAWAGAALAPADEEALEHYRQYGLCLGVLYQIADDYNGTWYAPGGGDLASSRPTLPVCYALSVANGPDRERLRALLIQAGRDAEVLSRTRELLAEMGAQGFALVAARVQQRQAREALDRAGASGPATGQLIELVDRAFPAATSLGG